MDTSELLARPHHMNPGFTTPFLGGFAAELKSVAQTVRSVSVMLKPSRPAQEGEPRCLSRRLDS